MIVIKNNRKGISLIVLIITIAVMIIIASAVIMIANGENVIGSANEAKDDTEFANVKELVGTYFSKWSIMSYSDRQEYSDSFSEYAKSRLNEAGYKTEGERAYIVMEDTTVYKYPVIPEGFVLSIYEGETNILDGLVIYETTSLSGITKEVAMESYNQYVWIPVPNMARFERRDGYYNKVLQTAVVDEIVNEPYSQGAISETNDLTGEYEEYSKMYKSVKKYGGFYIGRYEAGSATKRISGAENKTTTLVPSKKNTYAYNFVGWGPSIISTTGDVLASGTDYNQGKGATELSRSIYPKEENYEVVSTLVYGIQWDAMMDFVKDIENVVTSEKKFIEDSENMGWHGNNYASGNPEHRTGMDLNLDKNKDDNIDLVATNKVKNIYDLAGNVSEITMEAWYHGYRSARGYSYKNSGAWHPGSGRGRDYPHTTEEHLGFRVALYIK